jgi:hypothetical protein
MSLKKVTLPRSKSDYNSSISFLAGYTNTLTESSTPLSNVEAHPLTSLSVPPKLIEQFLTKLDRVYYLDKTIIFILSTYVGLNFWLDIFLSALGKASLDDYQPYYDSCKSKTCSTRYVVYHSVFLIGNCVAFCAFFAHYFIMGWYLRKYVEVWGQSMKEYGVTFQYEGEITPRNENGLSEGVRVVAIIDEGTNVGSEGNDRL